MICVLQIGRKPNLISERRWAWIKNSRSKHFQGSSKGRDGDIDLNLAGGFAFSDKLNQIPASKCLSSFKCPKPGTDLNSMVGAGFHPKIHEYAAHLQRPHSSMLPQLGAVSCINHRTCLYEKVQIIALSSNSEPWVIRLIPCQAFEQAGTYIIGLRVVGREAVKNMLFQLPNTQAEIQTHISDLVCQTRSKGLIHSPEKFHKHWRL